MLVYGNGFFICVVIGFAFLEIEETKILTLFDDYVFGIADDKEVKNLQQNFDKFYIITYEIDQAKMISSINMWMPNPSNNKAYFIDDLTELIRFSPVDLTDIDISVLENDNFEYEFDSPAASDYDIFDADNVPVKKTDDKK